jgi:hypothetical protein
MALRISFCGYCGDFFARADSLARYCRNRPPECLGVTPDEALTKRRETERVHVKFQEKLERYLRTNEEIGSPFAQEMYPGSSSKRGSRQQSRLIAEVEALIEKRILLCPFLLCRSYCDEKPCSVAPWAVSYLLCSCCSILSPR